MMTGYRMTARLRAELINGLDGERWDVDTKVRVRREIDRLADGDEIPYVYNQEHDQPDAQAAPVALLVEYLGVERLASE